ncbi:MAG: RpiB/LacA/LacB family sugar-phosphate isomerase [Spirochaetales bacterium]|nr:RpiB/LacA/LacB family sugar-phosphate isomerase [Spirochaetales bacterium]
MKIAIGCDPNAAGLKTEIIEEVRSLGHQIDDLGSDDPIYPNVAFDVGRAVVDGKYDRGIVMCGTGIGISIAANKVPGVYCALVTDAYQAERAALSNNANLIALGQLVTGTKSARLLVRTFLANTQNFDTTGSSAPKVNRIVEFEKAGK